jgi:stage V sporulation protein D (sporulation-specific penicillin-binding protein)
MFGRTRSSTGSERRARRARPTGFAQIVRSIVAHDPFHGEEAPGADFERRWRIGVKQRTVLLLTFVALWVVCIEARLVHLQVVLHEDYSTRARRQQNSKIPLEAGRGDITDRHGRLLAYSVEAESLAADPSFIDDPARAVAAICKALEDCTAKDRTAFLKALSSDSQYKQLRPSKLVTPEQIERIRALELSGIIFPKDNRRYNPLWQTAAHIIGNVGTDNEGLAGVEYSFNTLISGVDGRATAELNRSRQRLQTVVDRAPVPGASLELTIDTTLQHIAERELKAGVEANRAVSGTVVVMDPNTGEVLAMASYPTFNPNAANRYPEDARRNRAVQDIYEPGSTFKIVTASAAIDEGVVRADELIDTNPGYIVFGGRKPITDDHPIGIASFEDVIVKSSNVGAIKAGLRVGPERLKRYVERFGFGQTIAPELAGENGGIWSPANLTDSRLASVSMGYEIGVTPVQMAAAASVIANGGRLLEPHVVRAVIRDGHRNEMAPKVVRQVVAASTAATMTSMMEGVVERGTATRAQLPGYRVAGKTGTSKKAIKGGYSNTDYNASFVGFLPSRRPAFTILVVIDTPRAGTYYGGTVAAPIFRKIAEAAVQHAGLAPTEDLGLPMLERPAPSDSPIQRIVGTRPPTLVLAGGPGLMPDLTGLSARDALRAMTELGLAPRMSGSGFVLRQRPAAGSPFEAGISASIELSRTAPLTSLGDEP